MHDTFNRLKEIEQKCLQNAKSMPSVDGATDDWTGIGFKLAGISLLSSMGEVTEILDVPPFTRVPGVQSWVVGIANVRGGLLPLMDLRRFVTGESTKNLNTARVMVVNHKGLHTGLIVEEVQGMRHFSLSEQAYELPDVNNHLKPYIRQAFQKNEGFWPVFSMHALVEDERFLHASL
jgi:twitching motility protein PilI